VHTALRELVLEEAPALLEVATTTTAANGPQRRRIRPAAPGSSAACFPIEGVDIGAEDLPPPPR